MSGSFDIVPVPASRRDMFMLVENRSRSVPEQRRAIWVQPDIPLENNIAKETP
ncbi:hypothetical protein LJR231_001569 [Phyllobacterium sp. LjRoot231]|uniref:hypothetical protein n=1 Tax=Phyllobacterium sp. LjRoot231 TaxID=3342289 RepID=UPI003ED14E7F